MLQFVVYLFRSTKYFSQLNYFAVRSNFCRNDHIVYNTYDCIQQHTLYTILKNVYYLSTMYTFVRFDRRLNICLIQSFRNCAKNEMSRRPHKHPICGTFHALAAYFAISLMRGINPRPHTRTRSQGRSCVHTGVALRLCSEPGFAVGGQVNPKSTRLALNPLVLPSPQNTYNPHKHTLFTQLSPHQVVGTTTPTTFSFYRKTINQTFPIPL